MVVALWRRRHRCRASMRVQTLGRRTTRILRYRLVRCDLFGAPGLLRHRRHGRAGAAGRDRRLAVFVAAAKADIGKPLQQRQPALLRMVVLDLAAGLPDFGLRRHRQLLELRHPRRAGRRPFGRLWNERLRRRLFGRRRSDIMIRKQRGLLRDRTHRDIAIGRGLHRRSRGRSLGRNRGGDCRQRRALDIV